MTPNELMKMALSAMKMSYSPYSGYRVGAALLAKNGKVYTGCNIENAAYSPTVCAERCAVFKAVSEGVCEFDAIAVVGSRSSDGVPRTAFPCGVCRQVLSEFCDTESFMIYVLGQDGDVEGHTLAQLLPESFGKSDLG